MKIYSTNSFGHDSIKMLIYGQPGVGKTTTASGLNAEHPLIISAEAGLLSLADTNIDVIDISKDDTGQMIPKEKRIDRLGEAYRFLLTEESKSKYKTVFIDSLTEIAQNLVEQLNVEYPERKDTLPMWGDYAKRIRALIKSFRDLPGYNVIFTALSTIEKDENNKRFHAIDLQGKISNQLPAFFDEVFFMFTTEVDGEYKRQFLTQTMEGSVAKDRSGKLDKFEPANLGRVFDKIRGLQ